MSHASLVLAGRYQLAYRIARGGTGEVWRGMDHVLDRPVAVKLLRAEYAEHPETLARFRAEARHTGSLSHPCIAQVYDYGEADPPHPPYLVMEVVDGPSLAEVLATGGPLDPARVMDVLAQAAAGLAAAHRAGLVHRDIKPANLLLRPDGRVKITDFGIAHAAGSAPLTRAGTVVGTPAYLAPERAGGAPALPASDLYSLGVVAFECLTGMVPFQGSPLEVAAAHCNRPLPSLPRAVPPEVAALVADLTAKDTADRLAIAAEVAGRAGRLRDAITGHRTARLQQLTQSPAPAYTAALPLTPPETRLPDQVPGRGHRRRGRAWSWRQLALAVAAALFLAALGSALAGSLSHTLQWRPSPGQSPEPSLLSGPPASYPKSASSPSPRHPHGQERGSQQGNDDGSG